MHYTGKITPVTRGSDAGTKVEIVLEPGDFVTSVNGCFCDTQLTELGFTTNKGMVPDPTLNAWKGLFTRPGPRNQFRPIWAGGSEQ